MPRRFYDRPALRVARDLLGQRLIRRYRGKRLSGIITETEAYLGPNDPASHARHGPESRAAPMFGPLGHAYVYFTYGMHHCMNCVVGPPGSGTGVLIRAIRPESGIETMRRLRAGVPDSLLTKGPGRLCQAMAINLSQNREDLLGGTLWLEKGEAVPKRRIRSGPRVGIRHGRGTAARFYVADETSVSAHPRY